MEAERTRRGRELMTAQGTSSLTARRQERARRRAHWEVARLRRLYEELYLLMNPYQPRSWEDIDRELNTLVTGEYGTAPLWRYRQMEEAARMRDALEFGDRLSTSLASSLLYGTARLAGMSHDNARAITEHPGYELTVRLLVALGVERETAQDIGVVVEVVTQLIGLVGTVMAERRLSSGSVDPVRAQPPRTQTSPAIRRREQRARPTSRQDRRPRTSGNRSRRESAGERRRAQQSRRRHRRARRQERQRRQAQDRRRRQAEAQSADRAEVAADRVEATGGRLGQRPRQPPQPGVVPALVRNPPGGAGGSAPPPGGPGGQGQAPSGRQRAEEMLRLTADLLQRRVEAERRRRAGRRTSGRRRGQGPGPRTQRARDQAESALSESQWIRERREALGAANVLDDFIDREMHGLPLSLQAWEAVAGTPLRRRGLLRLIRRMRRMRGRYLDNPAARQGIRNNLVGLANEIFIQERVRQESMAAARRIHHQLGDGWRIREYDQLRSTRRGAGEAPAGALFVRGPNGERIALGELTDGAILVERVDPRPGQINTYVVAIGEIKSPSVIPAALGPGGQFASDRRRFGSQDVLGETFGQPGVSGDINRQQGRRGVRHRPDEIAVHPDAVYVLGTPRGSAPTSEALQRTRAAVGGHVIHVEGPLSHDETVALMRGLLRATIRSQASRSQARTDEALRRTQASFGDL